MQLGIAVVVVLFGLCKAASSILPESTQSSHEVLSMDDPVIRAILSEFMRMVYSENPAIQDDEFLDELQACKSALATRLAAPDGYVAIDDSSLTRDLLLWVFRETFGKEQVFLYELVRKLRSLLAKARLLEDAIFSQRVSSLAEALFGQFIELSGPLLTSPGITSPEDAITMASQYSNFLDVLYAFNSALVLSDRRSHISGLTLPYLKTLFGLQCTIRQKFDQRDVTDEGLTILRTILKRFKFVLDPETVVAYVSFVEASPLQELDGYDNAYKLLGSSLMPAYWNLKYFDDRAELADTIDRMMVLHNRFRIRPQALLESIDWLRQLMVHSLGAIAAGMQRHERDAEWKKMLGAYRNMFMAVALKRHHRICVGVDYTSKPQALQFVFEAWNVQNYGREHYQYQIQVVADFYRELARQMGQTYSSDFGFFANVAQFVDDINRIVYLTRTSCQEWQEFCAEVMPTLLKCMRTACLGQMERLKARGADSESAFASLSTLPQIVSFLLFYREADTQLAGMGTVVQSIGGQWFLWYHQALYIAHNLSIDVGRGVVKLQAAVPEWLDAGFKSRVKNVLRSIYFPLIFFERRRLQDAFLFDASELRQLFAYVLLSDGDSLATKAAVDDEIEAIVSAITGNMFFRLSDCPRISECLFSSADIDEILQPLLWNVLDSLQSVLYEVKRQGSDVQLHEDKYFKVTPGIVDTVANGSAIIFVEGDIDRTHGVAILRRGVVQGLRSDQIRARLNSDEQLLAIKRQDTVQVYVIAANADNARRLAQLVQRLAGLRSNLALPRYGSRFDTLASCVWKLTGPSIASSVVGYIEAQINNLVKRW